MLTRLALAVTVAALLLPGSTALAAIDVTRTDDPAGPDGTFCGQPSLNCSLRGAIQAAEQPSPPSNTITVPAGNYELTRGELLVNKTMFIYGAGARTTTIEQLKPSSRVIRVTRPGVPSVDLGLFSLTITGGAADDGSPGGPVGGGIDAGDVGVGLTDVAVVGNRVFTAGGATIAEGGGISNAGVMTLKRVTVANNHATADANGGAAAAIGAGITDLETLYAEDSTIAGNVATVFGAPTDGLAVGGVDVGFASPALLSTASVTISDNRASGGTSGGVTAGNLGVLKSGSELRVVDTIFARGTGEPGHENCALSGPLTIKSRGYNLQDRPQQCGLTKTGDLVNVKPLLGALASNGGPTDTEALGVGSPAINHGSPGTCPDSGSSVLTVDQRLKPRVQGGRCDIGAFESTPPPLVPPPHLTGLHVKPTPFKRGKGTTISYVDSRKATTTLTVLRRKRGVKKGGKCVAATKGSTGTRCTLFKPAGSFKHSDTAGAISFHWNGKLGGKPLGAGRYRLRAVASNAHGKSAPVTVGFKVVK